MTKVLIDEGWLALSNRLRKEYREENIALRAALAAVSKTTPECPYCGAAKGLRVKCDGGGYVAPEYTCEDCFTGTDTGPSFDDLKPARKLSDDFGERLAATNYDIDTALALYLDAAVQDANPGNGYASRALWASKFATRLIEEIRHLRYSAGAKTA